MSKAWRAEYDHDVQQLVGRFESLKRNCDDTQRKLQANSPKNQYDKEQSSAYVFGLSVELEGVGKHLNNFAAKWDLILTQGGYERKVLGEWSDTP